MRAIKRQHFKHRLKAYGQHCCAYCHTPLTRTNTTRDHIIPRCSGSTLSTGVDNLVLVCYECNQVKGDADPVQWAVVIVVAYYKVTWERVLWLLREPLFW